MKFIVMSNRELSSVILGMEPEKEYPFIFPHNVNHGGMAQAVEGFLKGWVPVSGGTIHSDELLYNDTVHGRSNTLDLDNRGAIDLKLIQTMDSTQGEV